MRDPEDTDFEPMLSEHEELVRRLRELRWPTVRPEVRERCWAAFNQRLADRWMPADEPRPSRRNAGTRLEYSRRRVAANVPPALISSGRRSWAARPTRRLTAFVA
jgi:hypothetical protein